jgi:hypothetical protein
MKRTLGLILLLSASAWTQSLVGNGDAIASRVPLSSIQFLQDGRTLVSIDTDDKLAAWTLPEGTSTVPPAKWRIGDDPIGANLVLDRDYKLVVTTADGRTWSVPTSKTIDYPIGYDESSKRVYYYDTDGLKVTIFSVLEGGKDKKKVAQTTRDAEGQDQYFLALGAQIFRFSSTPSTFTVRDLTGKTVYSGRRTVAETGFGDKLIEPYLHVSPDGQRLRIDNRGERIFVRMTDGVELLRVSEDFYRVAADAENRYIAFLSVGNGKDDEDITQYRIKVYFIADEPAAARYSYLSAGDGLLFVAREDRLRWRKKWNDDIARIEARKRQEAADAEAARERGATASPGSGSGSSSTADRVAGYINVAASLISMAKRNMQQMHARRDEGADKGNWCVYVSRAAENLTAASASLDKAATLYLPEFAAQLSEHRQAMSYMRRDVAAYGCH